MGVETTPSLLGESRKQDQSEGSGKIQGSGRTQAEGRDSISMYAGFNQQRLFTDSSISSFINIDNQGERAESVSAGIGGSELPYGRGYSIVNGWSSTPSENASVNGGGAMFSSVRRPSEQQESFSIPRFKNSSFLQSRTGSGINQVSIVGATSGNQSRNDAGSSLKRASIFFGSGDTADLDFFGQATGSGHDIGSASGSGNNKIGAPISKTGQVSVQSVQQQNEDIDAFFISSLSRKNSIKFNTEDFADLQFKRRNSSVRPTLENANYVSGPPSVNNCAKRVEHSLGSIGKNNDEIGIDPEMAVADAPSVYVEDTLKRQLTSLISGGLNSRSSFHNPDSVTSVAIKKHLNMTNEQLHSEEPELKRQRMKHSALSPVCTVTNADHHIAAKLKDALTTDDGDVSALEDARPLLGATKVDQLMLVIQARKKGVTEKVPRNADGSLMLEDVPSIIPPPSQLVGGVEKPKSRGVKQHECPYCHKCFTQSTHLEVHVRSHIGYKPFQCEYCGKRFTQGGNLRTHVRLHTGERPYECDKCGKLFSRKGNLAAHTLTHENYKPFQCKLDDCSKSFTQLGNMKAHQNRFHLQTLNRLTQKLAEMDSSDSMPTKERELLEYFASLYKNSNRGIKGRGKGNTRIVPSIESEDESKALTNDQINHQLVHQKRPSHGLESNCGLMTKPTIISSRVLGSMEPIIKNKSLTDLNYSLEIDDPKAAESNAFAFNEPPFDSRANLTSSTATDKNLNGEVHFKNVFLND